MLAENLFASPAIGFALQESSQALTRLIEASKKSVVQIQSAGRGGGTGVIWNNNRIVTNHHVVVGSRQIEARLIDGRVLPATLLASDPQVDLALLSVDDIGLAPIEKGDSRALRVGELAIAIGHPWGQPWVATAGVISSTEPFETPAGLLHCIRSDLRLAPGNSGGPMLNSRGQLVGINALIMGGDLSVAIASHVLEEWINRLQQGRARLGVGVQSVTLPEQPEGSGLLVLSVQDKSLAAKYGLLVGDILLELGGVSLQNSQALHAQLQGRREAEQLDLLVLRGGKRQQVALQLETVERIV
jgi:serine protease Do